MAKVLDKVGTVVEGCDWFAAPILLRYDSEDKRASKTGGIFSIILIVLLVVAFYNSWLNVLDKK